MHTSSHEPASQFVYESNDIEKLFPKCPLKQASNTTPKRPQSEPPKKSAVSRKQRRMKVHQYSRRELEARRNKNRLSAGTSQINESSDDNEAADSLSCRNKRFGKRGRLNSAADEPSPLQSTSTGSHYQSSNTSTTGRRAGKYTASKNLLQELNRPQSSYSINNTANNNLSANANDDPYIKNQPKGRGIVKSSSSFAFPGELMEETEQTRSYPQPDALVQLPETRLDNSCGDLVGVSEARARYIIKRQSSTSDGRQPLCKEEKSSIRSSSRKLCESEAQIEEKSMKELLSKLDRRRHSFIQKDSSSSSSSFERSNNLQNGRGSLASVDVTGSDVACQPLVDLSPPAADHKPTVECPLNTDRSSRSNSSSSTPIEQSTLVKLDPSSSTNAKQEFQEQGDKYINIVVYDNENHNQTQCQREELELEKTQVYSQVGQSSADLQQHSVQHSLKAKSVTRFQPRAASKRDQQQQQQSKFSIQQLDDSLADSKVVDFDIFEETTIFTDPPKLQQTIEASSKVVLQPAEHLATNSRSETEFDDQFVTINHEVSQQLLTSASGVLDEDEGHNLVLEDATVEELCNSGDQLKLTDTWTHTPETLAGSDSSIKHRAAHGDDKEGKNINSETTAIQDKYLLERKLIGLENNEGLQSDDKTDLDKLDNAMYGTKKPSVTPGYPQRVTPLVPNDDSPERHPFDSTNKRDTKQVKSNLTQLDNIISTQEPQSANKNLKTEVQRVKFDEKNLVSVLDDARDRYHHVENLKDSLNTGKHQLEYQPHAVAPLPQLTSIRDAFHDSKIRIATNEKFSNLSPTIEKDLSTSLERISLTDSLTQETVVVNSSGDDVLLRDKFSETGVVHPPTSSMSQPLLYLSSTDSLTADVRNPALKPIGELYSTARRPIELTTLVKSSTVQFTVLSDAESGLEEMGSGMVRSQTCHRLPEKKSDSYLATDFTKHRAPASTNNSSKLVENDLMGPLTKTALIFPRLDEGLSSDAESYGGDDAEEEDEKAMDADVDADDDDDEDDDEDEADEDIVSSYEGPSMDVSPNYPSKHAKNRSSNKLSSSQHQHQVVSVPSNMNTEQQGDLSQFKSTLGGPPFGCYINQDSIEQTGDIRSVNNSYSSNHNGSYTMGLSNQPNGPLDGSTASSSQQHPFQNHHHQLPQRNHNETGNVFKQQQRYNRDEGKVANRINSDTDNETDRLLGNQRIEQQIKQQQQQQQASSVEGNCNNSMALPVPSSLKPESNFKEVLYEGVVFIVKYLGSTHSDCEGRGEKEDRIHQAEMAVHEVKLRDCESRSAIEVQLFISTEKIMVLDDKHSKVLMDHSLRTISYIADIGDAIVLIVRKKSNPSESTSEFGRPTSKISCHVFESSQSHTITKSISQAFQVAYTELLKANGSNDVGAYLPKETDYQEVLNSQEMSTDELEMFARKDNQREVIVPKEKGEILGLSIVESGWGSVLPTVVIANLKYGGPAYRCKKLSIGDQILSINGVSLVGLPLADCQEILRRTKKQRVARLSVVPCPITVEVKIKRPDTKYQLGFSVQNGVICSLLRGGIAERGGVRVGHRIMSINGTTVVNVPHEKIVSLLASSVGEIKMKTCLTSLYRQILGEENPVHF